MCVWAEKRYRSDAERICVNRRWFRRFVVVLSSSGLPFSIKQQRNSVVNGATKLRKSIFIECSQRLPPSVLTVRPTRRSTRWRLKTIWSRYAPKPPFLDENKFHSSTNKSKPSLAWLWVNMNETLTVNTVSDAHAQNEIAEIAFDFIGI